MYNKDFRDHDIIIKYVEKEEYAEQLKHGGLFMHTPKYYKEQGLSNFSKGDPNEFDDLYPMWCASLFRSDKDFKYTMEKDHAFSKVIHTAEFNKKASSDVIKALTGFDEFAPLGNYAVVIFNAALFIGQIVTGITDIKFRFKDNKSTSAIPIECGQVRYGDIDELHPKLYKADNRFSYQREYRLRAGLFTDTSKYDVPLDLSTRKLIHNEYQEITIMHKDEIIEDYNKNGYITFINTYISK